VNLWPSCGLATNYLALLQKKLPGEFFI